MPKQLARILGQFSAGLIAVLAFLAAIVALGVAILRPDVLNELVFLRWTVVCTFGVLLYNHLEPRDEPPGQ